MKTIISSLLLGVGIASMVGCTHTQSTPPKIPGCKAYDAQVAEGQPAAQSVALLTPELVTIIGVESARARATAVGLPQIHVALYNCTDVDLVLMGRTQFSGEDGPSEPQSAWKDIHLPPRGRVVYSENGISNRTQQMLVEIHDKNRGQSQFAPGQTYKKP